MHVYRWDLDKTYLATDIHSVRGMIRSAFEPATHKRNVPGAATLLRSLIDRDPGCRVSILSGSPTQMREVLEEKLALDGIRFDSLVLKDNLGNIRRGRFRAIRGQVGYKLPQLLKQRVGLGRGVTETLFGDDSEVDALVYTLYADAIAGRVGEAEVSRIMEAGKAYPDQIKEAVRSLRHVGNADAVEDIFIHIDRGLPITSFARLGPRVIPVFSWFQAALVLWTRGRLGPSGVVEVAREVAARTNISEVGLGSLFQDLVRRGHIETAAVFELIEAEERLKPYEPYARRALDRLGPLPPTAPHPKNPDYLGFLRAAK